MRIIWVATAAVVALSACQTGGELGGGDPGWELDDDPFVGASDADTGEPDFTDDDITVSTSLVSSTCLEDGSTDNLLEVSAVDGVITVSHSGLVTACEATWAVSAAASTASSAIYVDYTDTSGTTPEQDGCWCAWSVSYTLSGVPTGTYTLHALSESASVTLE